MLPNLGPTELIIILVIVLLIFGPGKIANLGGSLGKSIRDFKTGLKDDETSDEPKAAKEAAAKEVKDSEVR